MEKRVIFVLGPTAVGKTKYAIEIARALGGEIIHTPREKGMLGAAEKAEELLRTIENSVSLRQFENLANPMAHYLSTGREIYEDMDGEIDYFVAGAGTGGTHKTILEMFSENGVAFGLCRFSQISRFQNIKLVFRLLCAILKQRQDRRTSKEGPFE